VTPFWVVLGAQTPAFITLLKGKLLPLAGPGVVGLFTPRTGVQVQLGRVALVPRVEMLGLMEQVPFRKPGVAAVVRAELV